MSVTFDIIISEETKGEEENNQKEFIKELKKLKHENRKIFRQAGTAKAGLVGSIVIAVVASLVAEVIKKKGPDAIEATKKIVKQIFASARAKGKNVTVVLNKDSEKIEFMSDSETELDSKLKVPT